MKRSKPHKHRGFNFNPPSGAPPAICLDTINPSAVRRSFDDDPPDPRDDGSDDIWRDALA